MNTTQPGITVRQIESAPTDELLQSLAELLVSTVHSGGAVSFLTTITTQQAQGWWRSNLQVKHPRGIVLIAHNHANPGHILGTVQLQPAWAPNQPARAEVAKLMVHPDARGQGIAKRLMATLEQLAADTGFTLLTLDTKTGTPAERLYESFAWTRLGVIPRFALDPDAQTHHDATIFYKHLKSPPTPLPAPA